MAVLFLVPKDTTGEAIKRSAIRSCEKSAAAEKAQA
jgi:hypothetical protein